MRIREKLLQPWVIVQANGTIESAHCTCMAGLDECCSHIAAVLFALETSARIRKEATVTDSPAYWMYPSSEKLDAPYKRIRDMDFQSAVKKRKECDAKPQPTTSSRSDISSPTKHEESMFLKELNAVMPNSAILSLTDVFSENFVPKSVTKDWPQDLSELYDSELGGRDLTREEIDDICNNTTIVVTKQQAELVESETRKQVSSAKWHKYRTGRITASNMHAVCHTNIDHPSVSLVKRICAPASVAFTSAATDWGTRKETVAKKVYTAKMNTEHTNFACQEAGLILNENYPQFGASPDGHTTCDCCGKGCLEIKCPFSMRDKPRLDISWLVDSGSSSETNSVKKLDRNHPYYSQIQMQLFLSNRQFCDFFVWCPNDNHLERIYPDNDFWTTVSQKALLFHKRVIVPELVAKHHSRLNVLQPKKAAQLSVSNNIPAHVQYCICGGADDGTKMVECSSENCAKQWFHFRCLKIKRAPSGKWLCRECMIKAV